MRIGRKLCGSLGCRQVHFLFPDLPVACQLSGEVGHSIFIAGLEQSEEWCARCGAKVLVPAAGVLSLSIPQYEDWTLGDFEQVLARTWTRRGTTWTVVEEVVQAGRG